MTMVLWLWTIAFVSALSTCPPGASSVVHVRVGTYNVWNAQDSASTGNIWEYRKQLLARNVGCRLFARLLSLVDSTRCFRHCWTQRGS